MSNEFYTPTGAPATASSGASAVMRAEFAQIQAAFDKFPAMSNGIGKALIVGASGTALALTVGTFALAGNFATTGAFNTTLVQGANVSLTLPIVSGTLATLAGIETLSNKTLVAPALGTPVSGVLTNATGLPIGSGISGLGTGVATALALPITAFASTVLGDATAAAARMTLGAIGEGDFTAAGQILIGQASGDAVAVSHPLGGAQIINGKISLSVGASALTAALKGLDGNDPSATNPVFILIPQNTAGVFDGTYAIRKVTAALSMVVSSGSTLGHISAVACPVYFYLLDNAGTPELAVSTKFFGTPAVVSTTAEGGAGAADSRTVMYSTAARSNVSAAVIGRWKSTQATAGTWASVAGEQQLYPFPYKKPKITLYTSSGANTHTKDWDVLWANIQVAGAGGGSGGCAATGASNASASAGGNSGGKSVKTLDAADYAATETATVGAGGVAGTAGATSGGTGGTSSFGSHCSATGGTGSTGTALRGDTFIATPEGAPGLGSGGDENYRGNPGGIGAACGPGTFGMSGNGGSSPFSGGVAGRSQAATLSGTTGYSFGGGAEGSANGQLQAAQVGGTGGNGGIIVEEFYQ